MLIFNEEVGGEGGGQWSGGLGGQAFNKDSKTEVLKMIGQRSNLCQRGFPQVLPEGCHRG